MAITVTDRKNYKIAPTATAARKLIDSGIATNATDAAKMLGMLKMPKSFFAALRRPLGDKAKKTFANFEVEKRHTK